MAETVEVPAEVVETTTEATVTPSAAIDPAEYARMQTALRAANKEAAERRKKLEAYELAEQQKAEAEMTASQKAEARAAKAEQEAEAARNELQTERLKSAFMSESSKAQFGADGKGKIVDWEAAFTLVKADPANAGLDPAGVADALKAATKKYPFLVGSMVQGAPPATPPESESNTTTAEKQRQREEYERRVRQNKP